MELKELLNQFIELCGTQRDKGTEFEKLIKSFLLTEPVYKSQLENAWLWSEFPYRGNVGDIGIDLVAKTYTNEYWAIQCKFYEEGHVISKGDVDTFLSASSKFFYVDDVKVQYSLRVIVSTTDKYGKNAEETLKNQTPEVIRLGMSDLLESSIDWSKFSLDTPLLLKEKYSPRPHQEKAINDVILGFENTSRGKLIMACGTGKTFTSLRCIEKLLNGKGNILFLVPSIALINQTLTEWSAQCNYTFNAAVVCSDAKAAKGDNNIDLKIPSTTDTKRLVDWVNYANNNSRDMNFVFSTYQSIDKVAEMQQNTGIHFDIIICDEAHRTTGVTLSGEDESYFVKVHDNDFIHADKRLYMTATPRIYGDAVKNKAKDVNAELCSMDNEKLYGPVFHNLTFSDAVKNDLLTDYKVLVLAIDEEYVKRELQDLLIDGNHEMKLDDSVKIMGCWNGLSKKTINPADESFVSDPYPMKRAVAFCNRIKDSEALVEMFSLIQNHIREYNEEEASRLVNIEINHVDGSFNALEKKQRINWLKESIEDNTCRILTNARCLSEGVDVPALDAVMFLNPRSSMVDIIQSVGRVMRKSEGKNYGYIILPIGVSANENAADALDNNEKYAIVWSVLQALRAHDDRFNNTINKIDLNKKKPNQISIIGIGNSSSEDSDDGINNLSSKTMQLTMNLDSLEEWRDAIYAKMVKKVGSRRYWESWAKDVAQIAQRHMERIDLLLSKHDSKIDTIFEDFLYGLQTNLNSSITKDDAIEMLSQHLITKPVFDALFDGYEFVQNNPVSQTMQKMIDLLDSQALEEEKEKLQRFYESVRERASGIDNSEGKQKIIIELYDKFFKTALPKEVEKLGIVYTPIECVDFIIHSVEKALNQEFDVSMSDKNVHIIDGFTGTGTFIVRLLQSGVIKKEDLLYKYTNEIHANEIVLLAYYIAAINIEETFHDLYGKEEYVPFEGIVLTDTFQLYEDYDEDEFTQLINEQILPQNSERAKKQRELPITVAISNPPYSVGQKNTNDDAANQKYLKLESEISKTYADKSLVSVNNLNALYDSYIKAFRWASNRISKDGIIGFITNGAFIDNAAMRGFRKCLLDEFTSIYVFNLRGNARTSGEQRRKEKDNVFGQGSRTPVAITLLIKNSNKKNDNFIHYYDIGDYLTREEKLSIISNKHDISSIDWKLITPDTNNDWINKSNSKFSNFIQIYPNNKFDDKAKSVFTLNSNGIGTSRDTWVYNFSKERIFENVEKSINYFNDLIDNNTKENLDSKYIHWSSSLDTLFNNKKKISFDRKFINLGMYRPFVKQNLYFQKEFIHRTAQFSQIIMPDVFNPVISITGVGANKPFSVYMSEYITDYQTMSNCQSFPLYWFEQKEDNNLFSLLNDEPTIIRHDGISNYFLKKCKDKYLVDNLCKEDLFYYVYGMLHSRDYTNVFEFDLKKSMPRIPLVEKYEDFVKFSKAGRELANLHLNYETIEPYKDVNIIQYGDDYRVQKMRFQKKGSKGAIIYNEFITISNIPEKAYEYVVNGKSAIEWIMERYAVTIDKKSGIVNDPNDWCKEVNDEKYIFNLLLSIINASVQTVDIINSLPKLTFE